MYTYVTVVIKEVDMPTHQKEIARIRSEIAKLRAVRELLDVRIVDAKIAALVEQLQPLVGEFTGRDKIVSAQDNSIVVGGDVIGSTIIHAEQVVIERSAEYISQGLISSFRFLY